MSNATPPAGTWVIDPAHSSVEFSVRHMMVAKVKGRFAKFSGTINVAEDPTQSSVQATILTASIDTRDAKRDEHLRSPDFFDADNFKEINFRSTSVESDGDTWKLAGELTIRDVTRPVTLHLEYNGSNTNPWGAEVAGFEASTEINRKDFGLEWNVALETGGVLVGDTIKISLEIEAARQAEEAEATAQNEDASV